MRIGAVRADPIHLPIPEYHLLSVGPRGSSSCPSVRSLINTRLDQDIYVQPCRRVSLHSCAGHLCRAPGAKVIDLLYNWTP